METISIEYSFTLANGSKEVFDLQLDPKSLSLRGITHENLPSWTKLEFHQCSHCPLTKDTYPRCPLSVNLVKIVERFGRLISYDEIQVEVLTEERHVTQKIAAHEGISSLMGLVIATSECPHTDFFKPMARFHLPFATHEETIWRAIGTYLITQYFLNVQGKGIDLRLDGLTKIYDNIEILNAAIVKRLRDASKEDSTINALIHLDIFAKLLAPGLQESLNILQKIFTPFLTAYTAG